MVTDVAPDQRVYSVAVAIFPEEQYANLYAYDVTERLQTEQAMARSKLEWERTFDSVPDLIMILGTDRRILRVNRAMAERLGKPPSQCVGLLCYECVHDHSIPMMLCPHQLTLDDEASHAMEMHDERLGGDFLVTTSPIHDQHGNLVSIVHVARDITAQMRAETIEREALALDCALHTAMDILEAMGEGVMLLDMDGNIMSVNPALEKITGIPVGESVGHFVRELIPDVFLPQDRQPAVEALAVVLAGQVPSIQPITLLNRIGEHIHVIISISQHVRDMEDQPRKIVVTLRDVSELHDAQESLTETNALLERIFDNTHLSIAYLDRDFNFIRVNRAYADVCQREPDFFPGKNHFALYPHAENEAIFLRVVETGGSFAFTERPFEFPDDPQRGVTYWDGTLCPLRGDGDHVESLLFCLIDVTARVRARQELVARPHPKRVSDGGVQGSAFRVQE